MSGQPRQGRIERRRSRGQHRQWAAAIAASTALTLGMFDHGVANADMSYGPDLREALVVGGTGNGMPSDQMMHQLFDQGIISDADPTGISYPAEFWPLKGHLTLDQSVSAGVASLGAELGQASGPVVVVGISQGAVIVNYEKSVLMAQEESPSPHDIVFVTIGDPTNSDGGLLAKLPHVHIPILDATIPNSPIDTPYDTVEIVHEYDGYADFPDNPLNLLAVLNALAGVVYEHPNKSGVDLSDPRNIVTVSTNSLGATTTHVLVPTEQLPLTRPLRALGIPDRYVDALDVPLKSIIDTGYDGRRPGATGTRSGQDDVRTDPMAAPTQLSSTDESASGTGAEHVDVSEPLSSKRDAPETDVDEPRDKEADAAEPKDAETGRTKATDRTADADTERRAGTETDGPKDIDRSTDSETPGPKD